MNTKTLANHYSQLSAEERFRLFVAAGDRGDETEQNRISNASKIIAFYTVDYSPFRRAHEELAMLTFLDLVEMTAMYRDAWEQWTDTITTDLICGKKGTKEMAKEEDRSYRLYLAVGFLIRTKAAGWKLFCDRMGILPFSSWQHLPGFERLQSYLDTVEEPNSAYTPMGVVRWLNSIRPSRNPEVTEAQIKNATRVADFLDAAFRERVKWWGGSIR